MNGVHLATGGQVTPVMVWTSPARGIASCVPRMVVATAAAAQAARTAAAAGTPRPRATASAPANVSPAPTLSTAWTGKPGTASWPSGPAKAAPSARP